MGACVQGTRVAVGVHTVEPARAENLTAFVACARTNCGLQFGHAFLPGSIDASVAQSAAMMDRRLIASQSLKNKRQQRAFRGR
eukprot:4303776-Amphidinium_carterae.1